MREHPVQQELVGVSRDQTLSELTEDGEIEPFVSQFQGEGIFPVNAGTHRLGRLSIRQILDELHDGDKRQSPRGFCRLTPSWIQSSEIRIGIECAEFVSHLKVDSSLPKR